MRDTFPDIRVIVPECLAVLVGAVLCGHQPTAIVARVAVHTLNTYHVINSAVYPESRQYTVGGQELCRTCFNKHV